VGYLLIDRLEKEETESQMQGQDTERMKIEGERKKAMRLWSGVGGGFTCNVIWGFYCTIYIRSFLTLFYGWIGSVHRFQW